MTEIRHYSSVNLKQIIMKRKVFTLIAAFTLLVDIVQARDIDKVVNDNTQLPTAAKTNIADIKKRVAQAGLVFTENNGQVKDQYGHFRGDIDFKVNGEGVNVFIGPGEIHYQFAKAVTTEKHEANTAKLIIDMYRLDVVLIDANKNARVLTEEKQTYFDQYFSGQGPNRAYAYKKITYKEVYPNIDWVFYFNAQGQLEHDFIVRPGGNVADIKIQYKGATALVLNKDGSISAQTPMGTVKESAPHSYTGEDHIIASSFRLKNNTLSFYTAPHKGTLIIDPTLEWGTYYGTPFDYDDNLDQTVIRTDPKGNIYVAGIAYSMSDIATTGSFQSAPIIVNSWEGNQFLVKFNSAGQRLWATYYGKSVYGIGTGLACDKSGNVFLAGGTMSDASLVSTGAHQTVFGGGAFKDAYLVKFDSAGARHWATYYGGSNEDIGFALSCDTAGNVFMAGRTKSTDNIASIGSHKEQLVGTEAFFLAKFNSAGIRQWGTYYGENIPQQTGWTPDMTVTNDKQGNVFFIGSVGINPNTTPLPADVTTTGSHQPAHGGKHDILLVKFAGNGTRQWATWYGGAEEDLILKDGLAADKWGNIYLSGRTHSTAGIATTGSHQDTLGGGFSIWQNPVHYGGDAFLAKFNGAGIRQWATYYGGDQGENEFGYGGISCDIFGNVLLSGQTGSNTNIATTGSYQQALLSESNAYFVKFDSTGARKWGSYFGSIAEGRIEAVATNDSGQIFIAGFFNDYTNLATPGAHQSLNTPLFIAKFDDCSDIVSAADTIFGNVSICAGSSGTYNISALPGTSSYTWILPNGWSGSSTTESINITAANNSGLLGVAGNFSCGAGDTVYLNITVNPLPVPVITANGNILSTGSFVTYQWQLNGTAIPGATSNTYAATMPGSYTVVVTDNKGCKDTSVAYAHNPTSVDDIDFKNLVKIFPNPATSLVQISAPIACTAQIMSIEGKVLLQHKVSAGITAIDIQGLANGIYFIQISGKKNHILKIEKLVKQ